MDTSRTYALAAVAVIVIIAAVFIVWRPGAGPVTGPTPTPLPGHSGTPGPSGSPHITPIHSVPTPPSIANPASKYCADLNYTLVGQNCTFTDGTSCGQWAFYRGNCGKQFSFCEKNGYTLENRTDRMGVSFTMQYAVCVFTTANGTSECSEQTYQAGTCRPGQCAAWNQSMGGCRRTTVGPPLPPGIPTPISGAEQACLHSGGNISTALCCGTSGDFPNTCLIGACGCAPTASHSVRSCDCGEGKCFDGVRCVPAVPALIPSP